MPIIACSICEKQIFVKPCRIGKAGNYCSAACRAKMPRPPKLPPAPCAVCGVLVARNPSKRKGAIYCSRACSSKAQQKRVARICQTCGTSFEVAECFTRGERQGVYCSDACRQKRTGGSRNVPCAVCGKPIRRKPNQLHRYSEPCCSARCTGVLHSRDRSGADNPHWKGGYQEYYGPNWPRQRNAARKRDKYRCQHCGASEKKLGRELDVHHIQPFRTFGYVVGQNETYKLANELTNLISLCNVCHQAVECGRASVQPYLL